MKIIKLTDRGMELYRIGKEIERLKCTLDIQYESPREEDRKALLFYQAVKRMGFSERVDD